MYWGAGQYALAAAFAMLPCAGGRPICRRGVPARLAPGRHPAGGGMSGPPGAPRRHRDAAQRRAVIRVEHVDARRSPARCR